MAAAHNDIEKIGGQDKEWQHNTIPETTEIIRGTENIMKLTLQSGPLIKERLDNCVDSTLPANFITQEELRLHMLELKSRGIMLRFITDITNENVSYCKELMKIVELRHLDGIKGNFGIFDGKEYRATAKIKKGHHPEVLIRSTAWDFVEQQQYFFETLWRKAIPAKQRIREIEEGAKREVIDTIQDPYETLRISHELVKSAQEEIMIVFSTSNAFIRQEKSGALQLLKEAASRGAKVRILVPLDNAKTEYRVQKLREENSAIDIRDIKKPLQTKLTTMIVDQTSSLTVELKDDTKEDPSEAMGLATFSNSESTVLAYVSIFENMWMQTELHH